MTREQLDDMLAGFPLPEGWKFRVKYPVKWKDYKKYYKDKTHQDYLDQWLASTDSIDKIIYIAPYYVKYFTPMLLIQTIWHELGHVWQTDTKKGGHHNKNWYEAATHNYLSMEDEYIAKRAISERIREPKKFEKNMKLFLRSQKIKYDYYLPKKYL